MQVALEELRFGPDGLLPTIVQEASDGTVLMLAYMNREALDLTLQTGYTHFWSRSRQALWKKGETSGNVQQVLAVQYDCDNDALLVQVHQYNVACHTGQRSCFYRTLTAPAALPTTAEPEVAQLPGGSDVLAALYQLILIRRDTGDKTSYVKGLFQRGQDVICKKVAEEAAEVLLASKSDIPSAIVYEMADLWFHSLVLLGYHQLHPNEILRELQRRLGRPGGGKPSLSEIIVPPSSLTSET
jgi:phosphoribosyl-ATP pyrophosphohydrolase/phosphoribosyl-AMP cyclohydrolase